MLTAPPDQFTTVPDPLRPSNTPVAAGGNGAATAPMIDQLFRRMCELKASDLHLSSGTPPLVRKDGEMQPLADGAGPLTTEILKRLLSEIMPDANRQEFDSRHDTDFAYEVAGLARFRANVFLDRNGVGAVFRVIPSKILTAETLGLSP